MEDENDAAANIAAETMDAMNIPYISSTTPGIIKVGIDGQECMKQDILRRKEASNLNRIFFVLMGVCLFFNCFVINICAIKLV